MLLDFQHKVAFILIPKNASSSVRQTLMKHDPVGIFCNQNAHCGLRLYDYMHLDLRTWERVAIIRNPVDRHVSWWRYEISTLGTKRKLRTARPTQLHYVSRNMRGAIEGTAQTLDLTRVLRYENLEEDWAEFAGAYQYPAELMRLNRTPNDAPWPKANFIAWAQETYLEDYEAFGYPMMDEVSP